MGWAIQCYRLSKIYKNGIQALKDVTLNLEEGRIHVIIGPNGAGKTTFLKIVTTEYPPSEGTFRVLEHEIKSTRDKFRITPLIGVMPQDAILYKQLSVWEHIYYFTILKGLSRSESKLETERLLNLLEFSEKRNQEISTLSGGMMKTVNLAQALAGNPAILFLDEPTTGIDPEKRKKIWDLLNKLKGKQTIVLTTQYLDEAYYLADNIIIFNKGNVIYQGNTPAVMDKLKYKLKIEVPRNEKSLKIVKQINKDHFRIDKDNIVLWVLDPGKVLQLLLDADFDLSKINFSRPMLEEAYLDILKENQHQPGK